MVTAVPSHEQDRLAGYSPANLGLVGQMATSWGLAGGLLAACVVSVLMVLGELSASFGFLTTTIFFAGGWFVGFLHGGLVGYMGRPDHVSRLLALKRIGLAVLYALPAMLVGWCVAMCITLGTVGIVGNRPALLVFAVAGLSGFAAAAVWAVVEARKALEHLSRRWPGARGALALLGMAFLALLPFFVVLRPEIWFLGLRPTPPLAALMAAVATAWIGGPLAAVGLLTLRGWRKRHP